MGPGRCPLPATGGVGRGQRDPARGTHTIPVPSGYRGASPQQRGSQLAVISGTHRAALSQGRASRAEWPGARPAGPVPSLPSIKAAQLPVCRLPVRPCHRAGMSPQGQPEPLDGGIGVLEPRAQRCDSPRHLRKARERGGSTPRAPSVTGWEGPGAVRATPGGAEPRGRGWPDSRRRTGLAEPPPQCESGDPPLGKVAIFSRGMKSFLIPCPK